MRRRDVLAGAAGIVGLGGATSLAVGARAGTAAEPYAPLGRVEVDGAAEAVVGADGTTVYLAATTGFATVDVSDPASPTVLAERRNLLEDGDDGPMRDILDVAIDGDRLLVAGPANSRSGVPKGVLVYDVSDPTDPQQVAFHETRYNVHNCYLDGGTAYLTNGSFGQRIDIVDVSGAEPTRVARWEPTDHDDAYEGVSLGVRNLHDVVVQDGRAYLATWDAGTFILDVSDPAAPDYVGHVGDYTVDEMTRLDRTDRFAPPGNHHYVEPSDDGSVMAVGRESWQVGGTGGPAGITLYDLSTPAEPTELATIGPERARDESFRSGTWTTSHNFQLTGDRLYSSWYQAGVKLHDVSDPANPRLLAWWRDPADAAFWTARRAAGDVVVASTHAVIPQNDPFEGLYAFPDRAGEQADPPAIPAPTPTPTPSEETTPTSTRTPTEEPTPTPTSTPTEGPTHTPAGTSAGDPTSTPHAAAGDGFGLLAALAALGGAAWWRRRG